MRSPKKKVSDQLRIIHAEKRLGLYMGTRMGTAAKKMMRVSKKWGGLQKLVPIAKNEADSKKWVWLQKMGQVSKNGAGCKKKRSLTVKTLRKLSNKLSLNLLT